MPSDRWVWSWDAVAAVATAFAAIVAVAVAVTAYLQAHRDRRVRQREADRRWKVDLLGELLASYDVVSYAEVTGRQLRLLAMLGDVELPRWRAWVEVVGLEDRHDLSDMEGLDWFMATFAGSGSSGDYGPVVIRLLREELVRAIADLNGVTAHAGLRWLAAYHDAPEMGKGVYGPES